MVLLLSVGAFMAYFFMFGANASVRTLYGASLKGLGRISLDVVRASSASEDSSVEADTSASGGDYDQEPNSVQPKEGGWVPINLVSFNDTFTKGKEFDIRDRDVLVFLHIQKTGGSTFERHLVEDIDLHQPCQCGHRMGRKHRKLHCTCLRPGSKTSTWLFSRYNVGWKCGLHADFTELTECVDGYLDHTEGVENRRYFLMTFLRDPVSRYLSEFLHVQRGAVWKDVRYSCNGRSATEEEIRPCYSTPTWEGVTLKDFMECRSNMAVNRQTRMLSDLRLVNCYNASGMSQSKRDEQILKSAMSNLEKTAFFGLTSHQAESQALFERTFNLFFQKPFDDFVTLAEGYGEDLTSDMIRKIKDLNRLDVELLDFARMVMEKRLRLIKEMKPMREKHEERKINR